MLSLMQNPLEYSLTMTDKFTDAFVPKTFEFGEYKFESVPKSSLFQDSRTKKKMNLRQVAQKVATPKNGTWSTGKHYFAEVPRELTLFGSATVKKVLTLAMHKLAPLPELENPLQLFPLVDHICSSEGLNSSENRAKLQSVLESDPNLERAIRHMVFHSIGVDNIDVIVQYATQWSMVKVEAISEGILISVEYPHSLQERADRAFAAGREHLHHLQVSGKYLGPHQVVRQVATVFSNLDGFQINLIPLLYSTRTYSTLSSVVMSDLNQEGELGEAPRLVEPPSRLEPQQILLKWDRFVLKEWRGAGYTFSGKENSFNIGQEALALTAHSNLSKVLRNGDIATKEELTQLGGYRLPPALDVLVERGVLVELGDNKYQYQGGTNARFSNA